MIINNGRTELRHDTKENWASVNPILNIGEMCIEIDGATQNLKLGDGVTPWNDLPYLFKSCPYDVGDVLVTMNPTNPAERWKGTTWEEFAQGRVLIGAGKGTDVNGTEMTFKAGSVGGEYSHQLTVGELAAHTHTRGTMNITGKARMYSEYDKKNYSVKNVYQGAFYWTDALENSDDAYSTSTNLASGNRDAIRNIPFDASRSWTGATSSVGSNSKHNQIPTYISAHFYKRLS